MKIFCVYLCDFKDRNDYYLSLMPYGITSIAAFLEKEGHDVTLANFSSTGYIKAVSMTLESAPDAVAVSIFSFNRTESFKYIKEIKKLNPGIKIIAGGQHPTFLSDLIHSRYPEIDFIIKGEGEIAIKSLIDNSFVSSEPVISADRISDINKIPYGSLFSGEIIGINPNEQFKFIITSRGCPSVCTYCSSPNFWKKKVTYRSPQNIIEELKYIQKKFGIIYFSIRDDNFTLNKKRVMEFCRLLKESRIFMMWNCQARVDTIDEEMLIAMKKSGLEHIQFGVESGSEKILKMYDKRITPVKIKNAAEIARKTGIYLSFYLMTGMEGETDDDIKDTVKLLSETLPHDVVVSPVAYYPGTKIYSDAVKKSKITDEIWFISAENGIYLRSIDNNNITKLLNHSTQISKKSAYVKKDFQIHRNNTGADCWMNDIIEGDYYYEKSDFEKSAECYMRLINQNADNIWGYLRMAELLFDQSPAQSLHYFKKAAGIVPSYYGSWLRMSQLQFSNGNHPEALNYIKKAFTLNPFDLEIIKLMKKLTSTKKYVNNR